jgi:RHS repeat-associated protein
MPHDTSPRFTWRRSPHHLLRPQESLPPMLGPFTYNAYGQDAELLPEADTGDEIAEGPLFQGMRYDPEQASLFAFAYRAFNPTVNPWSNHEPLAYVDGMNLYTAPVVNPIHAVNPLGT